MLLPPVEEDAGEPPTSCPLCGSQGFNVHQRSWKLVKDLGPAQALVVRYRCKRCGHTRRIYPAGAGAGRQSAALRRLSVLLYCAGLSYRAVGRALRDLDCPLSLTTIRRNVLTTYPGRRLGRELPRLRLVALGEGRFSGPDGILLLRLEGGPGERWLEAETDDEAQAEELRWRLGMCARQHAPDA